MQSETPKSQSTELLRRIERFQQAPKGQFTSAEWRIVEKQIAQGVCRLVKRGKAVEVAAE